MPRRLAVLSALALLALILYAGLSGLLGGDGGRSVLTNARTGEPLTLDSVQQDVEWHRETAEKLRKLER